MNENEKAQWVKENDPQAWQEFCNYDPEWVIVGPEWDRYTHSAVFKVNGVKVEVTLDAFQEVYVMDKETVIEAAQELPPGKHVVLGFMVSVSASEGAEGIFADHGIWETMPRPPRITIVRETWPVIHERDQNQEKALDEKSTSHDTFEAMMSANMARYGELGTSPYTEDEEQFIASSTIEKIRNQTLTEDDDDGEDDGVQEPRQPKANPHAGEAWYAILTRHRSGRFDGRAFAVQGDPRVAGHEDHWNILMENWYVIPGVYQTERAARDAAEAEVDDE